MNNIIIDNGIIFRPDNQFHRGTIAVSNGRITNGLPENAERICSVQSAIAVCAVLSKSIETNPSFSRSEQM